MDDTSQMVSMLMVSQAVRQPLASCVDESLLFSPERPDEEKIVTCLWSETGPTVLFHVSRRTGGILVWHHTGFDVVKKSR